MSARGGCLCGDVRYALTGEPRATTFCHCGSCRRATGAPAVAWVVVRAGDLQLEQGQPVTFRSSPRIERTFCGRCGTSLTYRSDDYPDSIDIHTATLDEPDAFPPSREIWLEQKVAWMVSNDALERFSGSSRDSSPLPRRGEPSSSSS